jgi:EAL domain-containing protein (putative c-di-GMP-specific phosphodiesterase class I)
MVIGDHPFSLQGSIGIAMFPQHGASADLLMQKADASMYVAKRERTGYSIYQPERDHHTHRRLSLAAEFQRGLADGQLVLEYQPIVDARRGALVATEALIRWNHPELGRLMPSDFVSLVDQSGLTDVLTMFVVDRALSERPLAIGRPFATITVNLAPRNLHDRHFPEQLGDLLRKHGCPPHQLVLEITEDLLLADPTRSAACLSRLHEMGVRLSVDDFGTGYSSLTFLRRLPIDTLKVDRSLVLGVDRGDDEVLVRSTIDLAHNLGLSVVAEGVESQFVWNRLRALGCDAVQGMLIGSPLGPNQLRDWLIRRDVEQRLS